MHDVIRQYVEREVARDAWQEYRETGLHASAEEVLAWLDTWDSDSETGSPACHE